MKKGYKKLLLFQIITMIFILVSNFVSSILSGYGGVFFLILMLLAFKLFFGFEKDRNRFSKNVCLEVVICLLVYFLLYYLFGIIIGFAKIINFLNISGIFKVIIPLILTICLKEILRYMMLKKAEGSSILVISSCIFFVVFDLVNSISFDTFSSNYSVFIYSAIFLLPTISRNIFCTYVSYYTGYKPTILYLLIISLYSYFVPIVPNPNQYIYSIIELVVPMIFLYQVYKLYLKEKDEIINREYNKKKISYLLIPSLLVIFLVYITSGYFHYHAIAIASGSMTPTIFKGDVVVIEKVANKNDIEIGKIIAYRYGKIIVVHRLVKKIEVNGSTYFYTKGDANNEMDNYKITEDMIIGIVNIKVPCIGYPTVWINEL